MSVQKRGAEKEVQKEDIGESALSLSLKDELVEAAFDLYVEARRGPAKPGKGRSVPLLQKSPLML